MKFAKGHSKILMKNEQASALDVAREKVLEKYAIMLQRLARGFIVRRRLLFMRKVLKGLHEAIRKRSDALLAKWFAQVRSPVLLVCIVLSLGDGELNLPLSFDPSRLFIYKEY